uniref:Uncharacterized protein n=1 Tax=viral metagenome TaxID=1070528 RepID=A0A6C0JFC5_9ZZZZ
MDNSSSKSIMETINDSIGRSNANSSSSENGSSTLSSSSTTNGNGFFSSLFSLPISTWIIIIIILAFLGLNIFSYLAKGTQDITNFFTPIISKILGVFAMITGQVIDTTAGGAKAVVSTTTDVLESGLSDIQNATHGTYSQGAQGNKATSTVGSAKLPNAIPQADVMKNNTLNKALNTSNVQQNIGQSHEYVADDATSTIQKTQSKGGYCYIGEERGYRTCMPVNENDSCMSGEIFPTSEICINPSLRV